MRYKEQINGYLYHLRAKRLKPIKFCDLWLCIKKGGLQMGEQKDTQVDVKGTKRWYQKPKLLVGLAVVFLIIAALMNTLSSNLQGVIDLRPQDTREVNKYVSPENQRRVESAQREIEEQEKREADMQLQKEVTVARNKAKAEQAMKEPLKEGHVWHYDVLNDEYIQVPIPTEVRERILEQDESVADERAEQFFSDDNIKVAKPREEVIIELGKNIEDIDPESIYLTKGQFIFWLQDNLLYTVGSNSIQTFWDPDTRTVTVKTNFGDIDEVKELTEERIKIAYNSSSFNLTDPGALKIVYE